MFLIVYLIEPGNKAFYKINWLQIYDFLILKVTFLTVYLIGESVL